MGSDIDRKNCFIFYLQKKKKKSYEKRTSESAN